MISSLELQCVVWDTAAMSGGVARFFRDARSTKPFPSATATTEQREVLQLISHERTRTVLYRILGLPTTAKWAVEVKQPFLTPPSKPGDIDLMVADLVHPEAAVVAEAKWVKVRSDGTGGQKINKLEGASESVPQVAGLLELGFARTYLLLIAVVDDRSREEPSVVFRGTTQTTLRRVIEVVGDLGINESAGILYVEINQPLEKTVTEATTVCIGVLRPARVRPQSVDQTSRVAAFLTEQGRGA